MKGRAKKMGMRERPGWTDTDKEDPKAGGFHEALGSDEYKCGQQSPNGTETHTSNNKALRSTNQPRP